MERQWSHVFKDIKMVMQLADFIRTELEPILQDWQEFAETLHHGEKMGKVGLRDHAREMLLVIADDLDSSQSDSEQAAKSKGQGPEETEQSWAVVHGEDRHTSGFSVMETVSEFRALRASVVSHWTRSFPDIGGQQLEDLTRFHEAIDQAVAESLEQYAIVKEMDTRLFGAILVASPDPIHVLDLDGKFAYANQATADLFGLESKSIIGKSVLELKFSYAFEFQQSIKKVIADQSTYRGKFTHAFGAGRGERFEYLLAPVIDEQKRTEAVVCILRDITEQALAEEKIWRNAHHDQLTGLPNRRLFLDRLEQELKHAKRSNLPLAILFMDLDGFKDINDSLGHEAGDCLLADVADRLTDCVREEDTVARLGGDEFTVILSNTGEKKDAEFVAQTIVDALALPFLISENDVRISVSIGISIFPWNGMSADTLLQTADRAMYEAKKAGLNRIRFFEPQREAELYLA